jgi:DNA-binding transcriptional regulator YhcF (GntR family)
MRFWLARDSDVSIHEQLVTQIVLGILSGDLTSGQRLPSTRELARRFHLHANTISAAYRRLERECWVEFRHGSGVYIRKSKPKATLSPSLVLDQLIADLFRSARELGVPLASLRVHLRRWLALQPPDHFLLIEPDEDLRQIVLAEMQQAVTFPVTGKGLEVCRLPDELRGAIPVALPSKVESVRQALPPGTDLVSLHLRSVPSSLGKWLPAPPDALIGIASRWPGFLKLSRTMLTAAGLEPDSLVFLDAREASWKKRLKQLLAVVCDSLTAAEVPKSCRVISFPLLSEAAIDELRRYQQFVSDSLAE